MKYCIALAWVCLVATCSSASAFSIYYPVDTSNLDPNQKATVEAINRQYAEPFFIPGSFLVAPALGQALSALPSDQLPAAVNQLSDEKFSVFSSSQAFNNASFETMAMDNYFASQRSSGTGDFLARKGGIDTSGLALNAPGEDASLASIEHQLLAWSPAPLHGILSDSGDGVMGGVDMKDVKEMKPTSTYTDPWNVFIRGNVVLAQGFTQGDVPHFGYDTESVVVGTDYRITPNFLIGLSAGYAHTDATLDYNGSNAKVASYSPGIYASYADNGWYANFTGDYVHNSYTQNRVVSFVGVAENAYSRPTGNEGIVNLDGGYDFKFGALKVGPLAGLQYTHLGVDGFSESGGPTTDLTVQQQDADSLRSRLGSELSYDFHCGGIQVTPHLRAAWQHEFLDQSRGVTSSFNTGGGDFTVATPNPSRDSALVDVGANADINRTVSVFLDYETQVGQSNYFGQSVQGGVKIGF